MKLDDIAKRIHAHLKRFEADPIINAEFVSTNGRGQESRLKRFYHAGSGASGRFVYVTYITYQGTSHLTKQQATEYLAKLDAGFIGRHFEALRDGSSA